jgi:hypothetical protein
VGRDGLEGGGTGRCGRGVTGSSRCLRRRGTICMRRGGEPARKRLILSEPRRRSGGGGRDSSSASCSADVEVRFRKRQETRILRACDRGQGRESGPKSKRRADERLFVTILPLSCTILELSLQNLEAEVGIGEPDFATVASRTTSSPTTSSVSLRSMRHPAFAKNVITILEVHQHYPPTIPELSCQYTFAGKSAGSSRASQ